MRTTATLTLFLLLASTALAQTPTLVKDINPGTANGFPDNKEALVSIGNVVYFAADDGINGAELWRSDGTDAGTYLIKDIQPGSTGSAPVRFNVLGSQILFFANDGVHGDELWASDGTEGGTALVKDINPGPGNAIRRSFIGQIQGQKVINGILFFAADDGTAFAQLWRTDGTEAGTQFVANTCPTCTVSAFSTTEFTVLNDTLYLLGAGDLWRSDGETAGTFKVFDNLDQDIPRYIRFLTGTNGKLYLAGDSTAFDLNLWISDGTKAGTKLVKEFADSGVPRRFTTLGNRVFFISDVNLWSTDGTDAGTQLESSLVVDFIGYRNNNLYLWNNEIYYRAQGTDLQGYVYKTDGGPVGEVQVFTQNFQQANFNDPLYFASNDDYLFYDAINPNPISSGIARIHKSGTPKEIIPIQNCNLTEFLYIAGDNLFFRAKNNFGEELWKLSLLTSATKDQNHQLDLRLYPTYAPDGVFYLDHPAAESQTFEVRVFDATGRLQFHNSQSLTEPLRLSSLPAGTYFVRIANETGTFVTQKVIIGR